MLTRASAVPTPAATVAAAAPARRRRVVFLTSTSTFSGGDRHLLELIRRLDLRQVEAWIGCFGADNYSSGFDAEIRRGVHVQTGFRHSQARRTWRRLRRVRPDVVVFISGEATSFSWRHYLAARLQTPLVYSIFHNVSQVPPLPRGLAALPRRLLGFAARRRLRAGLVAALSHASICVSAAVRQPLIKELHFPAHSTHTVRNGVDLAHYASPAAAARGAALRQALGFHAADIVVVVACRLEPTKGVGVLLHALRSLRDTFPQLAAIVAGDGSAAEDLRRLAKDLGLEERVHWLGFQDDVRPCLRAGDIFVNPSSATCIEAFGLSLAEAMASGLACIASEAGAGPELIVPGEEGLLVAPGDRGAMEAAIARLASSPELRRHLGQRAQARAGREFDLEQCMQQILALLLCERERLCRKSA